ncbi:aminotransferase class I/II-fold pyridoxal phosphate-dependent enzyme [Streptomyces nitrosporeus]|uniref:Aminotransferase class I/II-fold pyridoxal phosphate-dependent enzyme n=1 Tax=Streptomyces nitrosporeus TaxID=28894 RepID=A0A5J6FJX0_9ACTN|nr:aminotransferase class I/II-fold pyridoxal phosphate-dependent enzyme [Streptomyces nitrosporeus]QEU75614.1 aminotransferase class I/II-fold pyridoxal phosphate-dependent enzyme [Streptomyces nitrosporeus]GGY86599.1 GntR family transcriptional regulator [Streptomyces nitrosporeus]
MLGEYRIEGRRASEIAASVERGVGDGELAPGQLLPPMRELANTLGVNPNTVAAAYRTLRERGVIETAGRKGSRVRPRPASTARGSLRIEAPPGVRDVGEGSPDATLLPDLGEALAAAAEDYRAGPGLYGEEAVLPGLARAARAGLDADGVPDGPVVVTSGSLDAVERVLAVHLKPGDVVAVEDPGWGSMLDLVPALGLRARPVALDQDGPLPQDVERALRAGARALVVTDRAQNPTGASVSAARARELRSVLAGYPQVLLIEDDHGHAIVDVPLYPLAGVTEHWAFVRSVAKAYGPDLRVAVLTGDALTLDRVAGRQRLGPGWVSRLLQRAVLHLWESGAVDPAAVARSYGERRRALVEALERRGIPAYGRSGMHVWVPVGDETGAVARLLHAGWAVAPGARFRLASPPGVRLTVSRLSEADIEPLADAVAAAAGPVRPVGYD